MEEEELPPLEEKKRYADKIDFESLVFRHIDRINNICIKEGKSDAYVIGIDQLASLSIAYGDEKLNGELETINDDFNIKKEGAENINTLKVSIAERKMDAIMGFLARSGLSGRKRQAKKNI